MATCPDFESRQLAVALINTDFEFKKDNNILEANMEDEFLGGYVFLIKLSGPYRYHYLCFADPDKYNYQ